MTKVLKLMCAVVILVCMMSSPAWASSNCDGQIIMQGDKVTIDDGAGYIKLPEGGSSIVQYTVEETEAAALEVQKWYDSPDGISVTSMSFIVDPSKDDYNHFRPSSVDPDHLIFGRSISAEPEWTLFPYMWDDEDETDYLLKSGRRYYITYTGPFGGMYSYFGPDARQELLVRLRQPYLWTIKLKSCT